MMAAKKKPAKKIKKTVKKFVKKPVSKQKKKTSAVPKGYHPITPYLIIDDASKAIDFYKKIFGAKIIFCMDLPNGKVTHADLKIGESHFMISDSCHEMNMKGPKSYGGCAMSILLYTKNVDDVVKQAVRAGATLIKPVENQFYGDRSGLIEDPFGHRWCIATHIEDVSSAKLKKRAAEFYKQKSQQGNTE